MSAAPPVASIIRERCTGSAADAVVHTWPQMLRAVEQASRAKEAGGRAQTVAVQESLGNEGQGRDGAREEQAVIEGSRAGGTVETF